MAQVRKYESNADRQAAYNARKREARRLLEVAAAAEAQRQAKLQRDAQRVAGQIIARILNTSPELLERLHVVFGETPEEAAEVRALVAGVSRSLMFRH